MADLTLQEILDENIAHQKATAEEARIAFPSTQIGGRGAVAPAVTAVVPDNDATNQPPL